MIRERLHYTCTICGFESFDHEEIKKCNLNCELQKVCDHSKYEALYKGASGGFAEYVGIEKVCGNCGYVFDWCSFDVFDELKKEEIKEIYKIMTKD